MANTTHYGLQKPAGTDYYDIEAHNANMDVIDGAMHDLETKKADADGGDVSDTLVETVTEASGTYPTFSAGQKLSVILGRIAKFFADLKANCITALSVSGKTITYTRANGTTGTITTQDTTYNNATTSAAGLMSAADKTKLDGIASGASLTGVKGNAETAYRTGNVNITPDNIGALWRYMGMDPQSGKRDYGRMISDGLLIQWGDCSAPAGNTDEYEVTFPLGFKNVNSYVVMATVEGVGSSSDVTIRVHRVSALKFKARCFNNGSPTHTILASYLAIGIWK